MLVLVVLAAIFYLTQQDPTHTGDLALAVERWLVAHVPPTGTGEVGEPTWAGLTIRKLAHIAEYAALGLVVALACLVVLKRASLASWGLGIALCAIASVSDQVVKTFVPGRHFDVADLPLDALGYIAAVSLANVVWALIEP
jgi:VanZ family protein